MNKRLVMIFLVLIVSLSLLTACQKTVSEANTMEPIIETEPVEEQVTVEKTDLSKSSIMLKAEDGVDIAATYYKPLEEEPPGVILLHMLDKDRFTWDVFAKRLQEEGYAVLAIDLRGHGESINQGRWQDFNEMDFNSMVNDARAAKTYIEQTLEPRRYIMIGASIGANVALNYAAADNDINAVILLSPGETYRGVNVLGAINMYGDRPLLIAASKEDDYSYKSSSKLHDLAGKSTFRKYEDAGHGTDMLNAPIGLDSLIVSWLDENI
ncbi:alpha/beta fold hydrolase [Candidatus Woesearchaeota archaeon]|nr:alpha/beta fold hydrolase [Candidatus Woesearchaeota archaeon]